jgi:hypothetical protein
MAEAKAKMAERMAKLKSLHQARNEARNQNHSEVKKEVERNSLPRNWEIRQQKADWLLKDKEKREAVEEQGIDYERVKLLNVSALEQDVRNFSHKDPVEIIMNFISTYRKKNKSKREERWVIKDLQTMRHRQPGSTSD